MSTPKNNKKSVPVRSTRSTTAAAANVVKTSRTANKTKPPSTKAVVRRGMKLTDIPVQRNLGTTITLLEQANEHYRTVTASGWTCRFRLNLAYMLYAKVPLLTFCRTHNSISNTDEVSVTLYGTQIMESGPSNRIGVTLKRFDSRVRSFISNKVSQLSDVEVLHEMFNEFVDPDSKVKDVGNIRAAVEPGFYAAFLRKYTFTVFTANGPVYLKYSASSKTLSASLKQVKGDMTFSLHPNSARRQEVFKPFVRAVLSFADALPSAT